MKNQEAGARALLLKAISVAPKAPPRMRAIATRFSKRFEAYRDQGISLATAYAMASAEFYLRKLDRKGAFA